MSNKENNPGEKNGLKGFIGKFTDSDGDKSNLYKILSIVLMVILIITLGSCGLTMYSREMAYKAYKDLATRVNNTADVDDNFISNVSTEEPESELVETESTETTQVEETEVEEEEEEEETLTESELLKQLGVKVPKKNLDWDELHAINPDIYAWLYIPNTEVEYPILQHPTDDNYYLNRNMDGSWGKPGCIFTQSLNHKDFLDLNTVVYGHNMKSGRMFQSLHNYEGRDFFDNNQYIYVYTEERALVYQVFAAYPTDDSHILNTNDLTNVEGYTQYLEKVFRESKVGNVREELNVTAMNRILTLSTCGNSSNQRYLVQAVLLNDPLLYGLIQD